MVKGIGTLAEKVLADYSDKGFSLTDATSFAIMERQRILRPFTFDRNFNQYGLGVLTPTLLRFGSMSYAGASRDVPINSP